MTIPILLMFLSIPLAISLSIYVMTTKSSKRVHPVVFATLAMLVMMAIIVAIK